MHQTKFAVLCEVPSDLFRVSIRSELTDYPICLAAQQQDKFPNGDKTARQVQLSRQ